MVTDELRCELRYQASRRTLQVTAGQNSACGGCAQEGGCGIGVLTRMQPAEVPAPAQWHASATDGDRFTASFPALGLLGICAAVYPVLAVLVLAGAWLGEAMVGALGGVAGGAAGLFVGALVLRLYDSLFGGRLGLSRVVIVPSGVGSNSDS